ncbi:MAG: hypothetical protein U0326_06360 [Polyangiales bacterium]
MDPTTPHPRLPFLAQFAEPVRVTPKAAFRYDPATQQNEPAEGSLCIADGTLITETAENKDHSEHRIECDGTLLTRTREARDASEGPDVFVTSPGLPAIADVVAALPRRQPGLGTEKTGNHEQSDPSVFFGVK